MANDEKFKLNVKERFGLLAILPNRGSYAILKQLKKFKYQLEFTPEEVKALSLRKVNGKYQWDNSKVKEKEIKISKSIKYIITKTLKDMDKNQTLDMDLLELYEKFIPSETSSNSAKP